MMQICFFVLLLFVLVISTMGVKKRDPKDSATATGSRDPTKKDLTQRPRTYAEELELTHIARTVAEEFGCYELFV